MDDWWKLFHGLQLGSGVVKEVVRQSLFAYTSWQLWLDQNNLVFNDRTKPIDTIFEATHALIIKQMS